MGDLGAFSGLEQGSSSPLVHNREKTLNGVVGPFSLVTGYLDNLKIHGVVKRIKPSVERGVVEFTLGLFGDELGGF